MAQTQRSPKRTTANRSRDGGRGGDDRRSSGDPRHFRVPFETKVWHDPLLARSRRTESGSGPTEEPRTTTEEPRDAAPDRGGAHGAALGPCHSNGESPKRSARIIAGPKPPTDPRELERQRLLARLLAAEGRPAITRAADEYLAAGFELPRTQEVWLQLLEHRDEERISDAIATLAAIVQDEPVQRRSVLESRLRRIAEFAEDVGAQRAAAGLRRLLAARDDAAPPVFLEGGAPTPPPSAAPRSSPGAPNS